MVQQQYLINEEFIENAILYWGIGVEELHREVAIVNNWKPFEVYMPLIHHDINPDDVLAKHNIRQPTMYLKNFKHNNCAGKCVKAGMSHFKNLYMKDEKSFIELMEQEIVISDYIRYTKQSSIKSGKQKDYMFKDVYEFVSTGKKSPKIKHIIETHKYTKNWNFGVDRHGKDIKKPFTFMKTLSLADIKEKPIQIDIWDIGGCGCAIDYGRTENVS